MLRHDPNVTILLSLRRPEPHTWSTMRAFLFAVFMVLTSTIGLLIADVPMLNAQASNRGWPSQIPRQSNPLPPSGAAVPLPELLDLKALPPSDDQRLIVTDHKNLELLLEPIKENRAGITEEAIRARAELRMRSAGLKPYKQVGSEGTGARFLYVNLNISGADFNLALKFERVVYWVLPKDAIASAYAIIWERAVLGGHGDSSARILETLDGLLDQFLNAYLKANQQ